MTILNSFPYKNISLQTNHRKEIFQFTQNTNSTHRKTTKIQIAPHLLESHSFGTTISQVN